MSNQDENFKDPNKKSSEENYSEEEIVDEVDPYPLPTNQDYLSYYVYQNEWKPTKPLGPISAMWNNPGPGIVNLPPTIGAEGHDPTKPKAPGYKIGMKHSRAADPGLGMGPGPGKYNTHGLTNMGKDRNKGPVFGTAPRFKYRDSTGAQKLPGPSTYDRLKGDKAIYRTGPGFLMPQAKRTGGFAGAKTPAPNAYHLPTAFGPGSTPLSKAPAFSIGKSRRDEFYSKSQSPGPAHYMLPPNNTFMNKSPAFHMATKAGLPTDATSRTPKPGPYAAHLVKFDKFSGPRITFGIRHSPYKVLPGFAMEN